MAENKQDVLARASAMFTSLRKNIAQIDAPKEKYVPEFHTVLDRLEGIGIDISEFRIPDSEVQLRVTGATSFWNGRTEHSYSEEKYVDRSFILTKLDVILGYIGILTSEKPGRIGFTKPDE